MKKRVLALMMGLLLAVGCAAAEVSPDARAFRERIERKTQDVMAEFKQPSVSLSFAQEEASDADARCEDVAMNQAASKANAKPRKAKALYCLDADAPRVAVKGAPEAEVLELLADNVATAQTPDFEQLLAWQPDVILFAPEVDLNAARNDPRWQGIGARFCRVPSDWLETEVGRPMGLAWLGQLLYPERFQYDLMAETRQFYKLFYGEDLTEARYDEMMAQ